MKQTLFLLLTFIGINNAFAQTVEATTSVPTQEYMEALISKISLPDEITEKVNNPEIEATIALTITKEGSVFNPSVQNDSLGLKPYIKEAFADLPNWNPKTENGVAVASRTAFKIFIPTPKAQLEVIPANIQAGVYAKATPAEGIRDFYASFVKSFNSEKANKKDIEMRLQFFVQKDGSLTGIQVIESNRPELNLEAVRVLKSMPKWVPAIENGVPVISRFSMPVKIKLQNK